MWRFVKKDVLLEVLIVDKFVKVDVIDKSIYVNYKKIDIGFLIEKVVKDFVGVSEK